MPSPSGQSNGKATGVRCFARIVGAIFQCPKPRWNLTLIERAAQATAQKTKALSIRARPLQYWNAKNPDWLQYRNAEIERYLYWAAILERRIIQGKLSLFCNQQDVRLWHKSFAQARNSGFLFSNENKKLSSRQEMSLAGGVAEKNRRSFTEAGRKCKAGK